MIDKRLSSLMRISALALLLAVVILSAGCNSGNGGSEPWAGKERLVPFGNYPVVSPDGALMVFGGSDGDSTGIWLYQFSSGNLGLLVNGPTISDYVWSPFGDQIAYSNPAGGLEGGIWVVDTSGNQIHLVDSGEYPHWSPDGSEIAFQGGSGGGIFKVSTSGGEPEALTTGGFRPKWSPDGNYIAFFLETGSVSTLQLMNATGGAPEQLANSGSDFDWSPDSEAIVFHRYEAGTYGYTPNIKTVAIAGHYTETLWTGGTSPRWSPDGDRIVFEGISGSVLDGIFVISPSGGSVEQVSQSGSNPVFRISKDIVVYDRSDGVWIAYRN